MQITAFAIMSLAVTTVRCFSISRRVSSSFFSISRRSLTLDATKFNTADLQGKLMSPISDGVDLIDIGIASTSVKNTQSLLSRKKYPIDKDRVKHQISAIKQILGVPHFQVDVWFCSDRKIGEMNGEWRQKTKATDILSFPANDFESPGVFADDPSIEFQKHLGDLVVAPNYVMKQCEADQIDFENGVLYEDEDAGVSKEMATKFTLEERIPLLFIHGMLHLLGYDHETDEDFAEMTAKEDEVIAKFKLVKFDKL